jgi:hypothetical protein
LLDLANCPLRHAKARGKLSLTPTDKRSAGAYLCGKNDAP